MPRPPRTTSPTGWYHLINRGADRQDTFSQEADHVHFESLIGETSSRAGVDVHAYCLMTNHFHLVVNAPDGGVPDFMRELTGTYSLAYNRRNSRLGPLFAGRYRSIAVETDAQLVTLGRYVHRNPLSFVPVHALSAYRWSSYGVYCGRRSGPAWLRTGVLGGSAGPTGYRQFVEMQMPHDDTDAANWARAPRPTVSELERRVAEAMGVDPATVRHGGRRGRNGPRTLLATLAVELRLASASELAAHLGLASADAVRTLARRGRVRVATDPAFDRSRSMVLAALRH